MSRSHQVLLLAALATPATAVAASFEPAPCPFTLPPAQVEGEDVECGYLVVPEDRDAGGRAIRLGVAILRDSFGEETAPDPVLYLSGGPGASALEFLSYSFRDTFSPLLTMDRDVVLFDQRGVGVSQPALDCPLDAQSTEQWSACAETLRAGADLSDYHTLASAHDVNELRLALGYDQVNLWGGSYGTRLALEVMREHPEALRSVVLDAVYPPDVDLILDTPSSVDRAFGLLFASCAADPACDAAYPDLGGTLQAAATQLDAQPATIRTVDPFSGQTIETPLDGTGLVSVLFRFQYATSLVPVLPQLIHDAAGGRFALVERYLGAFLGQATGSSTGMQVSVLCHDEVAFSSPAQLAAAHGPFPLIAPIFASGILGPQAYAICDVWQAGEADARADQAVGSDVPTLLLAGDLDPITPPEWAERAAATLSRAQLVRFPTYGHGAGAEACGREVLRAFVVNPHAPADASCASELAVRWALPGGTTALAREPELLAQLGLYGAPPGIP